MMLGNYMAPCYTCTDMPRAKHHLDDTVRILWGVLETTERLKSMGYLDKPRDLKQNNPYLFHSPIHNMCGVCHVIQSVESDLRIKERELAQKTAQIYAVYEEAIKDENEDVARLILEMANLFRGYYPIAVDQFLKLGRH